MKIKDFVISFLLLYLSLLLCKGCSFKNHAKLSYPIDHIFCVTKAFALIDIILCKLMHTLYFGRAIIFLKNIYQ